MRSSGSYRLASSRPLLRLGPPASRPSRRRSSSAQPAPSRRSPSSSAGSAAASYGASGGGWLVTSCVAEPVVLSVESMAMSLVLRIFDRCFNSAMTTALALRPLSARSVVLSLLLGAHPAELSAAALVRAGDLFEVPETTLRAALSRMVAAGDLVRDGSTYRLSERLLERQRRQDAALDAETTAWDGSWEQVVITSSGRSAQDRADLRATLASLRLGELREGVWLRPANLARPLPVVARRPDRDVQGDPRRGAPSPCPAGSGTSTGGPPTVARCSTGSRAPAAPAIDSRSAPPSYDICCGIPLCPRS